MRQCGIPGCFPNTIKEKGKMFNWFKKKEQPKQEKFMITEGVMGYWHYHISDSDTPSKSLCGKHTMRTSIPLVTEGKKVRSYTTKVLH